MDRAAPQVERGDAGPILFEIGFSDIAGWGDDDHAAALAVFSSAAPLIAARPPKTRTLGIDGEAIAAIARRLLADPPASSGEAARIFFEQNFAPFRIETPGFVTGYFEPEALASRTAVGRYRIPLYRRPSDLVEVGAANRPDDWDPEVRFGRKTDSGLGGYFDRAAIENGALAGRGLELAFLENPVDAFFVHVQGSARLRFEDGAGMRIAFDGKSGHRYTSIGRLAVERGILKREDADKDGLEAWLKGHPREARALMQENRSFIFFRATEQAEDEGPCGAAGVPLTPFRSLAVDRTLHTFHTPLWVDAPGLSDLEREGAFFRRLMIAEDTGSAIVGPARGDIFYGTGADAGSHAGRIRHPASMVALVPRTIAR